MKPGDCISGSNANGSHDLTKRVGHTMTPAEIQRLTTVLRNKQAELSRSLRNRDEIVIEKSSDAIDEVQSMEERELAIRNLDRDSNALRQIDHALSRITKGTHGVCLHCEEDILPKRMTAVPWAAFCITCQELIDHSEIDAPVELLAQAA
jgi:DnaK suppressor protein